MLDRSRWWAWGGVLSAWLALATVVPAVGCKEEKSAKDDGDKKKDKKKDKDESDDDDKPAKKKSKGDDDDDDKPAKKKSKGDDDDDKPKKKSGDDDDSAKKTADGDAGSDDKTIPKTGASTSPSGTAAAVESFAGNYSSTWGKSTFTQTGETVTVVYPRGTMACTAKGKTLFCRWKEGATTGGAVLTKQANGTISGTWGSGASSSNGGPWVFTKT